MYIVKEIKKDRIKILEMSAEEKKKLVENMRKIWEKWSDQELLKKFMSTQKKVRTDNALRSGMIKWAINTHPEWRQQDKFIDMYGSVKWVGFWEMSDEKRMAYTEALTRWLLATAITAWVGGAVVWATSFGLRLAGAAAFIESTSNAAIIWRSVLFWIEFYWASQFTANIIQWNSLTNWWNNVHEIGKSVLLFLIMWVGAKYGEWFLKKVFGQWEIREFTAAAISRAAEWWLLWATPNLIEQIIFRNDVERRWEELLQALMLTMVVMPLTQKWTKFVVEKHKWRVELNARLNLWKLEWRNFIENTEAKIKYYTCDEAASLTVFQRIYKEAKGKEPTPEIEGKYKELVEAIKANDTAKVEKLKWEFDNIFDYKEPKKTKEQILEAKKSGKEFVDGLEERIKAGEEETALLEEFKTKYKESTGKELPKKLEHTFTEYVKAVKNGYDAMKIDNKKALDKIFKYKEPKRSKEQFLEAKKANKTFVNNIEELVKRWETKEGLLDQYRISYKDITGKELPKELENKFTEYIEAIEAWDNAKMESLKKELEKPFEDTRKIWWRRRKEFRAEKAENIKEAKNFLDELNEEVKPWTVIVDMEILVTEFKTKYESATGKEITPWLEKLFKQYVDEINKWKTTEAAIDKEILKRAISWETRITDEFKGQLVTYMQEIETKIKNGSETRSSEELAQDFATKFKEITWQDAKIFPDLFKLFLEDLRNWRTVEAEKLKNDLEKSFDTLEIVEPKISWINKITNKFKGFIEKGRNLFQKIKEFIKSLRTKAIDGRRTDLEITEKGILDVYKENYKEIFGKDMPWEKVTELEGLAKEYVEKVKSGKGEEAEQVIYKMEEVRKEFENWRKQSMLESFLEDYRQETWKEFPSEELPELKTLIDEYVEAQNTWDAVRAKQILDEIKLSWKEIIELSEPIFDEIQSWEYINQEFKDLFGKLKKRNSFVFDPMEFPGVDNINIKTNINWKDIYFAPKRGFKNWIEITCGYYFENWEIKTLNLEKPFFWRKSDWKIIDEQLWNLIDNFSFDPKLVETIETRNWINLIRWEGVKTRIKKFFEFREPERYSIPGDGGNGELSKKVTVNWREITVNESRFDIALNSSSAWAVKSVEELTTKIIIDWQEFFFKESRLDNSGEQKVVWLRLNNWKLEIAEFVKTEQWWNLKKWEKLVPVDDNLWQTFDSFEEFKPTITETAPTPEVAPIQSIETKSIGTGKEVWKEYGNHITKNRVNDEVARKEILNMGLDPEEFWFNADIKIDTNIWEFYLNTKPERCLLPESDARRNNYNPWKILSYRMSEWKVSVVEITKTEHGWEAKEWDNSYKLDEIFESTLNDNFNK